jgi:tetratricopeptide (TPR) repeat protein
MRPCLLSLVAFSFRLQSLLVFLLAVGLSLPFTVAHAQDSAIGLLKQMIAIAADNGGVGRTEELNALKAQIEGLPKPAQGNKQASRIANDKGLAAFKAGQYAQAQQLFLAGYQANAADVELAGNLGFTYIKLGDFKQAVKTLSAALALMPGRSSSWANLAEAYARQGQPQAAVACYALTFQFSQNQNKTIEFLQKQVASADDSKVQQAAQQALQLSLISGEEEEEEMADATPEGESLDAPLPPPAAPVARSLPAAPSVAAAPPVVAPPVAAPAAPPVATAPPVVVAPPVAVAPPPLVAPVPPPVAAAPVTPPPAPSVATSPIPASLPPAASPKVDAAAAALPASGTDTTTAGAGTNDIVEVVAQGMGTDQNSALLNAYSNAVQQALGLYVDAETMVKNDQIVRDQILTYSKGFIQKVDIVSQNQASGLFQVNIRAQVKRQKLMEQAKVNNIALKSVDGASLHGQVLTQVKQEEDAKALLTKALSPFTGVALLRVELVGEPKTVKQDKDSVNVGVSRKHLC